MSFRKAILLLICALAVAAPLFAVKKTNQPGKLLSAEQKTRGKVDLYLVNTPVTSAVPYFLVSVEFGDMDFVAEYTPRSSAEELPAEWQPEATVQGRVENHHLF